MLMSDGNKGYRVSFDVGGTFTDLTLFEAKNGKIHFHKVPSTPLDPSIGISLGLSQMVEALNIKFSDLSYLGHGTTVATNMVIERRGSPAALITTKGFRDVLEIGRQTRPHLYNYNVLKPVPLVPRHLRFEVPERMSVTGEIVQPLDLAALDDVIVRIRDSGVRAVAVCFLHSYKYPDHERQVGKALQESFGDSVYVSLSSDILPEFREFERLSTTVLNAYVGPRMSDYMKGLVDSTRSAGALVEPHTIHSNGGLMSVKSVRAEPVRTCLSGPAAGVIGAAALGLHSGFPDLITCDVGGTSTDVSIITNGKPTFAANHTVADYPVQIQMVDVNVIGAGGGSIARIDEGGALKVGPQSAGAVPGPIAYDRGGELVTVTDANIVLGRLDPVSLLNGRLSVNYERARAAIEAQIAQPLGLTLEEAAYGILRIANANMSRAIRRVSTEKGFHLKNFALCAFGGAGALHAAELAVDCQISTAIIPEEPGTMCARGILLSDISMDFVRTVLNDINSGSWKGVRQVFQELVDAAMEWLTEEKVPPDQARFVGSIEARYQGQNYEISIPVDPLALPEMDSFIAQFGDAHQNEYGYRGAHSAVEAVNCRVTAIGVVTKAPITKLPGGGELEKATTGTRKVYFDQTGWQETLIYDRSAIPIDVGFSGPAIIDEMSSTTVILPRQQVRKDAFGNLIIRN